jgi:ATP-binding cassette subfamily B protein IrtB
MIRIIRKFFAFCPEENSRKFHIAIALGVVRAFFEALKIPAVAVMLQAVLGQSVTGCAILLSFVIMAVSVTGAAICTRSTTILQTKAGYRTCAGKRIEIAEHMRYLPMGYFNEKSLGDITSVMTNSMSSLENVATRVILLVTQGMLTTVLIIAVLFFFDWRVALILLIGLLLFLAVNSRMQKISTRISEKKTEADTKLVGKVLEFVQGIAEVRAYRLTSDKSSQIRRAISENCATTTEMEMVFAPYSFVQNLILRLTGVAMAGASIAFYLQSSMDLVTCILMIICSFMVYAALETAGSYSAMLRTVDICVDRAQEILNISSIDIEGSDSIPAHRNIDAEQIGFAYDNKPVIRDISLHIPENKTTAIVGPSGGGKTTLASLLARIWDVDRGRVLLDQKDLRDYSMDRLMANYSFVFQNVYLFHDTIANNIRFSNPDAPMEAVIEAAKKACCHDFITQLPDGYETVIGEHGGNLSGGERQRISIARAIMKDAPIVILDEATANVDPENEAELMGAIDALTREKTIIMIAHRLKTVRKADQILVVDQGRIVQKGTHEELMRQEGIYRRFVADREKAVSWRL